LLEGNTEEENNVYVVYEINTPAKQGGGKTGGVTPPVPPLSDACIRRSYPQTVLLFKMILIKMIPFIFSKDT
jgi:hypothetical protein